MKKLALFSLAAFLFSLVSLGAEPLPYEIQSALLVKSLAYDKNLDKSASNGAVQVGVVYDSDKKSEENARALSAELAKMKARGVKVKDYALEHQLIPLKGEADLPGELKAKSIGVVYTVSEKAETLAMVARVTRGLKILSVTGGNNAAEALKKGTSMGLVLENGKPVILMNLEASLKEGREFSAQFLSLVKVVK
ncbi:MAG: YfiR family protein [Endomicrobiales bacterium]